MNHGELSMNALRRTRGRAFSLIELVIVVVIIGIIGAIAIPRMSRGSEGAQDAALVANLAVLRNALDLFQTEHGGTFPAFADMPDALLEDSDVGASTYGAKDGSNGIIYGPYLRAIPPLPVGAGKGVNTIVSSADGTGGWVYNESTGHISANTGATEKDAQETLYSDY